MWEVKALSPFTSVSLPVSGRQGGCREILHLPGAELRLGSTLTFRNNWLQNTGVLFSSR